MAALLAGCGPRHDGGGAGGDGGDDSSAGAGGTTAGGGAIAGGPCGGSASSGASGAGAAGGSGTAPPDTVVGCPAVAWPDAGSYFEAPPSGEFSTHEEFLLSRITAFDISGNGKVVVGTTSDPPFRRELAVAWSVTTGMTLLPPVSLDGGETSFESRAIAASCNGSVILQQDVPFREIYRTENGQAPVVLANGPDPQLVSMTPNGSVIVDGRGIQGEFETTPQLWTEEGGAMPLPDLINEIVYGIAPNGTLIAGNAEELFAYEPGIGKTPIGMPEVDFNAFTPSVRVAASGDAWAQTADLNFDSFLVSRLPDEPRSVTCPAGCQVVDVSGTAQVVLLEIAGAGSSIWSPSSGFVDLSAVVSQMGVDLGGRELSAVAISDDGRVVTGRAYDPTAPVTTASFFHLVLPSSVFAP